MFGALYVLRIHYPLQLSANIPCILIPGVPFPPAEFEKEHLLHSPSQLAGHVAHIERSRTQEQNHI